MDINDYMQELRQRVESLSKLVLTLAVGALSISIGVFTGLDAIPVLIVSTLKFSWWALTVSVVSVLCALFLLFCRDYWAGEDWKKDIRQNGESEELNTTWLTVIVWGMEVLGFLSFCAGFIGLCKVATGLVH